MRKKSYDKPLELRVEQRGESDYGIALFQRPISSSENNSKEMQQIVRVWGTPFRAITGKVLDALRKSGYRPSDLQRGRKAPFSLTEDCGVKLGILLLSVKPLRKLERIEAIANAVESMGEEEAYYWFSKCAVSENARRAQKALRILLARE